MLFNSVDFAIFLPVVFALYWLIPNRKIKSQNLLIVVASYLFYGWWDYRFLSLILFSTVVDYLVGIGLSKKKEPFNCKILLYLSILTNLGFLGFFKYYNFFLDNFIEAFTYFGIQFHAGSLNIILPVGISFYTFQTLSYTIDIYRKKLDPTKDFIAFAAFVSFFPQLVAGPIERASNLLPQFFKKRSFDYAQAVQGMRQILWGLFKKMVIADNCAEFANLIFNNHENYNSSALILGALFFTFQIYGDFSGYSDIAIGTARLFGFKLMRNFAFPYFSRDIAEFWRRWHISLSTWFRDYLYIPLGGSKGGTWMKVRNTFIIFIVSGFWHGANWTFIVWGFLNALYFLPLLLLKKNRSNIEIVSKGKAFPNLKEAFDILFTFTLTVVAWIFFRADSVNHAFQYIGQIFSGGVSTTAIAVPLYLYILIIVFIIIEWAGRTFECPINIVAVKANMPVRWAFYISVTICVFALSGQQQEFIYFQF